MNELRQSRGPSSLAECGRGLPDADPSAPAVRLAWLGQAGFAIRSPNACLLVDPYLSNSLGLKYAGRDTPHRRMIPVPVEPAALRRVTAVLCTHAHTDHMDPSTLSPIAAASPECRFLVPAAERAQALARGVPDERLIAMDDGATAALPDGWTVTALPAAHTELEQDAEGHHRFLGYVLVRKEIRIYHSGDTVAYPGLAERLRALAPQVALLPVNGRDAYRTRRGIVGNLDFEEAVALCRRAGIPALVPHHYGMFAENTVDERDLERRIAAIEGAPACSKPRVGVWMDLPPSSDTHGKKEKPITRSASDAPWT